VSAALDDLLGGMRVSHFGDQLVAPDVREVDRFIVIDDG
jgi:hypothetical protein